MFAVISYILILAAALAVAVGLLFSLRAAKLL